MEKDSFLKAEELQQKIRNLQYKIKKIENTMFEGVYVKYNTQDTEPYLKIDYRLVQGLEQKVLNNFKKKLLKLEKEFEDIKN